MVKPWKKLFFCILFCAVYELCLIFPQNLSAPSANRKTAVRYLKVSEQYLASKNWTSAASNAQLGLAYDDSISDLWYISSLSKKSLNEPLYKVISLVEKSLDCANWVDYNKDSARVFYADLLSSTGQAQKAIDILDSEPFIYSADAEYIRSKAYYILKDFTQARERIEAARRIYPDDSRFAELFFKFEYANGGRNEENAKLADIFINSISLYKNPGTDLEIFAAIFATGQKKVRMLKSFNARNLRSPLYAIAALEDSASLLPEEKALDYFYSFCNDSIDFDLLLKFSSLLKNEENKNNFAEYLNQYDGTIFKDTDGDLIYNLKVEYSRGRPQKICYDENQDELEDWTSDCDFGVPQKLFLTDGNIELEYSNWPFVQKTVYKDENQAGYKLIFNILPDDFSWSPFLIVADETIKNNFDFDFFVPVVKEKQNPVSVNELLLSSSSYEIPSNERKNASITVSLCNGKNQLARYFQNGKMYAQTQFFNGLPEFRTVDMDGDGLFETTETYGFDKNQKFNSKEDELQIMQNLFGETSENSGIYVKMIQIDMNGDTIPDYTEEYTAGEGKIASWDFDGDGMWDTRYIKSPLGDDGTLTEEALFYDPLKKELVSVVSKNGIPFSVSKNGKTENVVKAKKNNLYWLGSEGTDSDAEKILKTVNQSSRMSVCTVVQNQLKRMLAVKVGHFVFGQILPEEEISIEKLGNEYNEN